MFRGSKHTLTPYISSGGSGPPTPGPTPLYKQTGQSDCGGNAVGEKRNGQLRQIYFRPHLFACKTRICTCTKTAEGSSYMYTTASLHCVLSLAPQCIVIGPVYGGRAVFVGGCVGGSVTTITRNCVHRSSPNWVYR